MKKIVFILFLVMRTSVAKAIDYENSIEISYQNGNDDYTEFVKIGYVFGLNVSEKAVVDFSLSYGRGNCLGLLCQKYTTVGTSLFTNGFEYYWHQWAIYEAMIGYKYYLNNKDISPYLSVHVGYGLGSSNENNDNLDGVTFDDYIGLRFKLKEDNAFYIHAGISSRPYMVEYYYPHNNSSEFKKYRCTMLAITAGFSF